MRVTVSNYRFPFKEDLGIWTIIWDELGGSEGYVRLQATIMPNYNKLLEILSYRKYVNKRKCEEIILSIQYKLPHSADAYTISILNTVLEFCESKKQIIKKRSFSFLAAFDWGNTTRTDKCMKAIKKELFLDGEDTVKSQMFDFFSKKGVVLKETYLSW